MGHFISLSVREKLSTSCAKKWFETVKKLIAPGILSSEYITVDDITKLSDFYIKKSNKKFNYIIPITRDLSEDEAGIIAVAFDRVYDDQDFEINFSQTAQQYTRKHHQKQSVLEEIAREVAKKMHNDWVKSKSNDGWSYSTTFNKTHKLNPMMRSWDRLSEEQKLTEISRAMTMLNVLESINFKIVRN